ncbi:hypothetical protein M0804_011321 [Polistes exclamans]|nr:hypothetical protein M0804_011321 [Polistes exclamans]
MIPVRAVAAIWGIEWARQVLVVVGTSRLVKAVVDRCPYGIGMIVVQLVLRRMMGQRGVGVGVDVGGGDGGVDDDGGGGSGGGADADADERTCSSSTFPLLILFSLFASK